MLISEYTNHHCLSGNKPLPQPMMPKICNVMMNWVIIGLGNGLLPVRHQAITWFNAGLLSIGHLGTNFSEIWIWILTFSFKKMHLKMSSAKLAAILSRGRWVKLNFSPASAASPVLTSVPTCDHTSWSALADPWSLSPLLWILTT